MPCYHPVKAWYSGKKNVSGKRSLQFQAAGGFGDALQIACGQCIGCRLERSRQWAIRCMHENIFATESSFLTLTYAPEHLPQHASLVPEDAQKFIKRLRRRLGSRVVRYFLCGEYGETLARPHYHVLLFGCAFTDDRRPYKQTPFGQTYTSAFLDDVWGLGQCVIGNVSFESAGYVARYSLKKITGQMARGHYQTIDPATGEIIIRAPEFVRMSLKPAIGRPFFDLYKNDLYPHDYVVHENKKMRVPRYYDSKLPPEVLADLKLKRKKRAAKHRWNNSAARLAVREEIVSARQKTLKRDST